MPIKAASSMPQLDKDNVSPLRALVQNRRLRRYVVAAACLFVTARVFLWFFGPPSAEPQLVYAETPDYDVVPGTSEFKPLTLDASKKSISELCASFPKHLLSRIQPVLKTGHGDSKEKVASQMDSVSACFEPSELIIFSDLKEKIRNHETIDILSTMPETHYNSHLLKPWGEYEAQKQMQANGTLGTDAQTRRIDGWVLDKYKFLPMMDKTWAMRPEKEFYIFYETDTYIFWDNLFRLLATLDPDSHIYMGHASPGRRDPARKDQGTLFVNGGPGYVISRGAMKTLLNLDTPKNPKRPVGVSLSEEWAHFNGDGECCGDSVLGFVFFRLGVTMDGRWPMFTPYSLSEIPFNEQHWCQPIITLHKNSNEDMVKLFKWEFEQRKSQRPIIYSDVWQYYKPGSVPTHQNWEGGGYHLFDPKDNTAITTFEQCGQACESDETCLKYEWQGRDEKKCKLSTSFQHGKQRDAERREEDGKEKWTDFSTGYPKDRVEKWREERKCEQVQWLGSSVERMFRV